MKIFLIILGLLFSTIANAQSQRNPCVYGVGTNAETRLVNGNCLAVGYYLAGATGAPMPVGGIANASAPTFKEGLPGYLSFDLSGNLRISGSFTPSGTQNVNLNQYNSIAVPANGLPTQLVGTAAINTGQASVTTGNITIAAARTGVVGIGRKSICVTNVTGTGPVYLGNTGVTTSTGQYLSGVAGASICLDTQAAIFGTVATTSQTVTYVETF